MFRSLMLLTLAAFLVSTLTGCIVIDDHWWWGGHGGHKSPGQYKKGHGGHDRGHGRDHD